MNGVSREELLACREWAQVKAAKKWEELRASMLKSLEAAQDTLAAIDLALGMDTPSGMYFLYCWRQGDVEALRQDFPAYRIPDWMLEED